MKLNILVAGCLFTAAVAMPAAAETIIYTAELNGLSEEPSNMSPALGTATVTIDTELRTMRVEESFSGLLAETTASHIHCCTSVPNTGLAGVATPMPAFPGFPLGVTAGSHDQTLDMNVDSSYNPPFLAANGGSAVNAFNTLVAGLDSGTAYANIHTSEFPGGEIRGFLAPIPEPESYAMLLGGLGLLSVMVRRRRV
ncbi:PEP-CTERM protein-sorting domain-containing protein [Nitrosospira briensis]|uniref:PEP-CTERM protein-sorting domain-containing protein n=1 Tax=Nitrosospira briensis TaxID=35799 RepID=A0A1I4Y5T3_9PROT|nr:CHRD domain-containing protein [Nitrosospira briensis]SFN33073.1 PEP-CTERM protein-sorting domain-containing protein [Nitrosospira briensis]